jgi:hypothetical protein
MGSTLWVCGQLLLFGQYRLKGKGLQRMVRRRGDAIYSKGMKPLSGPRPRRMVGDVSEPQVSLSLGKTHEAHTRIILDLTALGAVCFFF